MRSHHLAHTYIQSLSSGILSLVLITAPTVVLAHAGHGDEFHGASEATQAPGAIQVDAETAKRLGIKVEPVTQKQLAVGIKTTGQIETLPNQKVEVTAPINGTVVELLVKPGEVVAKGKTVAVLSSAELAQLRVESAQKRAEAEADLQKAEADLKLAQQNYDKYSQIAAAEIAQAKIQLTAARAQYERDKSLVERKDILKIAKENYQRQLKISEADIAQAKIELAVAQEQYDRDKDLADKGAIPRRQMLESQAHLAQAKSELAKANSRRNVLDAETEVRRAEVDLPLREMRESEAKLAETQAQVTKANSRREVVEAEAELKRSQSAVDVAKSRIRLSSAGYETRLQQLGSVANAKGLVTVVAPISGTVADREVTPGQSVEAATKPLMTILNDSKVLATANIYEKDLDKVKKGQPVRVKVASLPNRTFEGKITLIGSVVEGETRVVPVKAELDNSVGVLKPGMFAELEVVTDKTATPVVAIPTSAVVESNGKQVVYVQNGTAFESVEVKLGQTSGDVVEIKSGLFDGDKVVTQGAIQLYAQSLRGDSKAKEDKTEKPDSSIQNPQSKIKNFLPWWWMLPAGGAIASGAFWLGRRSKKVTYQPSTASFVDFSIPLIQDKQESNSHQPTPKV